MVTKEPKSEKTTGRASTKKAVAAQPDSTIEESKAKTKATAAKTTTIATKVAVPAAEKAPEATSKAAAPAPASKTTTAPAKSAHASTKTSPAVTEEEIAKRAYILWLERGCPHGDSAQDWFAAKHELETVR